MAQTALYRHFDAAGRLLYVGISLSAVNRLAQHTGKPWFADIARVEVEQHPSREAALAAERAAIGAEGPIHNRARYEVRFPSSLSTIDPTTGHARTPADLRASRELRALHKETLRKIRELRASNINPETV